MRFISLFIQMAMHFAIGSLMCNLVMHTKMYFVIGNVGYVKCQCYPQFSLNYFE